MRKIRNLLSIPLVLAISMAGYGEVKAAPVGTPKETNIAIGTHSVGGAYYASGSGLAKVISDHSTMKAVVKPHAGPNAWMPQLDNGNLQLGMMSAPDAGWAMKGINGFPIPAKNLRFMMRGNINEAPAIIVRKDSGINNAKDLKGKPVAARFGGNTIIAKLMEAQMAAEGVTWSDVQQVPVGEFTAGLKALREGRVVATFGSSTKTPNVVELHQAIGVKPLTLGGISAAKIKEFPASALKAVQALIPGGHPTLAKAGTGFIEEDVILLGYPITLVGSAQMSDEAAYHVIKALYENYKELGPIYNWLKEWTPKSMFTPDPPAPYHSGAVRFWKEKGLWTAEAEQNQQALMAKIK